jgi:hypothetical protein
MPHLVLAGGFEAERLVEGVKPGVHRWGRAILKIEEVWVRSGAGAVLVEGLVVELARPLHPVALLERRGGDSVVRLWSRVPVERTPAVQRWLALVAAELQRLGMGKILTTNISPEVVTDLDLVFEERSSEQ